jgi:hypothetical protein
MTPNADLAQTIIETPQPALLELSRRVTKDFTTASR